MNSKILWENLLRPTTGKTHTQDSTGFLAFEQVRTATKKQPFHPRFFFDWAFWKPRFRSRSNNYARSWFRRSHTLRWLADKISKTEQQANEECTGRPKYNLMTTFFFLFSFFILSPPGSTDQQTLARLTQSGALSPCRRLTTSRLFRWAKTQPQLTSSSTRMNCNSFRVLFHGNSAGLNLETCS
jgi:hypothetical protein